MRFDRYHHGRPGLWADSLILSAMSLIVGVFLIIDGKGVTSSPAYDPAKSLMPMRAWGAIFIVVSLIALMPLVRPSSSLTKGTGLTPLASLLVFWAMMFAVYAAEHGGLGAIGAALWGGVAACLFVGATTYFRHARHGNGAG